jgi:hypothetical protein
MPIPSNKAWARVSSAVKRIEGTPVAVNPADRGTVNPQRTVIVKITSAIAGQPGRYKAKTFTAQPTTFTGALAGADFGTVWDAENCEVFYVPDLGSSAHSINLSNDSECIKVGIYCGFDSGTKLPIVIVSGGGKAGLFPVKLTKDGGANGSQTTKPTYTYTVKDMEASDVLKKKDGTNATGMSPTLGHEIGEFDEAEYGEAYRDSTGELVLWNAHEKEQAC